MDDKLSTFSALAEPNRLHIVELLRKWTPNCRRNILET